MKKILVFFCLLFVFTSCEFIILDSLNSYVNGNRSTVFSPNFFKEKIESLVDKYGLKDEETCLDFDGLYEGQLCYDENHNDMYFWNGVDWVLRNNDPATEDEEPGKQEIAFPEELINNYLTSDCNNYNNFKEDALYLPISPSGKSLPFEISLTSTNLALSSEVRNKADVIIPTNMKKLDTKAMINMILSVDPAILILIYTLQKKIH